ncbi:MAG: hypothetical protein CL424_17925, partial [Acidimicrobiaceae bacterium]|nr:hypothetical protein [Acidimicrobiaceae bacterium]
MIVASIVAAPAAPTAAAPSVESEPVQIAGYGDGVIGSENAIAYNPDRDEFLAVWSHNAAGADIQVWARRLDADGRPLGSAVGLMTVLSDSDGNLRPSPEVTYNPVAKEYAVVWVGSRDSNVTVPKGRIALLFGHRVSATGQPVGGQVQLTPYEPGSSSYFCSFDMPRIEADPLTGGYMMVGRYSASLNDPPNCGAGLSSGTMQVRSWRLAENLDVTGSQVVSPTIGTWNFQLGFAANPQSGGYIVTWARRDDQLSPFTTSVRVLGPDGAPTGNVMSIDGQAGQVAAADPETGSYLVTAVAPSSADPSGLLAHRFTATGARIGDPVLVTTSSTQPSDLVATGDGGWVFADINGNIRQLAADGRTIGDPVRESNSRVGLAMGSDASRVVALLRRQPPAAVDSLSITLSSGFESLVPGRIWDSRARTGVTIDGIG